MDTLAQPTRWHSLGVPVDSITIDQASAWAAAAITSGRGGWVATPNPEITVRAWREPRLAQALNDADLVLPDGVGMLWASRLLGGPLVTRVTGIAFLEACLELCARHDWSVFLLGAKPGVADRAAKQLGESLTGLRIVGVHDGYFPDGDGATVLELIRQAQPRLLAVGMGHPRQELWLEANIRSLTGVVGIACGGSLDVLAGDVQRAPASVQRAGLEWLYRLAQSPRTRIRRSMALPAFAARVIRLRLWAGK